MRNTLGVITALLAGLMLITYAPITLHDAYEFLKQKTEQGEPEDPITILFTGDIMLARSVELKMREYGLSYPFLETKELVQNSDFAIGNFEGVVNEPHVLTLPMTFQFSVKDEYLAHLKEVGFDVLSLGNNHSYDFGAVAHTHTEERCSYYGLMCGGYPHQIATSSVMLLRGDHETIGVLFLSTVWRDYSEEELMNAVKRLTEESSYQIAYVHWGEEYALLHRGREEKLAHVLIENGVDAVIGHHPHVVQDIEIYQGKPVFYSLGNFIFDQYFSTDVMEGLVLTLELNREDAEYTLIPIESKTVRSQPRFMVGEERTTLLNRVLGSSTIRYMREERSDILRFERK